MTVNERLFDLVRQASAKAELLPSPEWMKESSILSIAGVGTEMRPKDQWTEIRKRSFEKILPRSEE